MKWTGTKKIAFIPVYRTTAFPPDQIPANWEDEIRKRVALDPSANGNDRSISAWVRTVSGGLADVEPVVLPMKTVTGPVVEANALEQEMGQSLRNQGFDAAAIVMLGGVGAGTNAGYWSRFVMVESNGVWMMELMHSLTGLADFYHFNNDTDPEDRAIGTFDEMSASVLTHLTSYSKTEIGWLDRSYIPEFLGRESFYDLHCVASNQPAPPDGRWSGVRIGSQVPYIIVEARTKNDQFDSGIKSEGVIVYRVQTTNPYTNNRPGGKKPLYLLTTTALRPGESVTVDNDVVVTVTDDIGGGYRVKLFNPRQFFIDRTVELGLAEAASFPSASSIRGTGATKIVFRDGANHVWEVTRELNGQIGAIDLTLDAGATKAKGTPRLLTSDTAAMALFRGSDDQVRSLYHWAGGIGEDNLSGVAGAPKTASDPVGYYIPNTNTTHVIYRGSNGDLHELYWVGEDAVGYGGNLTGTINAPKAVGQPSAFAGRDRDNVVVYRSTAGEIRSIYWNDGPSGQDNLSGVAGTPKANGDPIAYYTPHNDGSQVTYRANDGHIWELYWLGANAVQGWDLTAASGAGSPGISDVLAAYYSAGTNTKHVIFRGTQGRLYEFWWIPGATNPQCIDLTDRYGLPGSAPGVAAFTVEGPNTQHVVYRGTNNHIYEVIWT